MSIANRIAGKKPQPDFKPCDFMTTFDVFVGSEPHQNRFTLHKDVMTRRSEYFRAARSKKWIILDLTRPTDLHDEDPVVFANYLQSAYFDRVHSEGFGLTEAGEFEENAAFDEEILEEFGDARFIRGRKTIARFKGLMKIYILANMLIDHKTANLIVGETLRSLRLIKTEPGYWAIRLIYDNTIDGDGMRKLWTDYYVNYVGTYPELPEGYEDEGWPNDFLRDYVKGLLVQKKREMRYDIYLYDSSWDPADGPHRYRAGPEAQGVKLPDSDDDEDMDYEPSEEEAMMTDQSDD